MGWSSGAELADNLWSRITDLIPVDKRPEVARIFIEEFKKFDCDCMEEATVWKVANQQLEVAWIDNDLLKITIDEGQATDILSFLSYLHRSNVQGIINSLDRDEAGRIYDLTDRLFYTLDKALQEGPNV